MAAVPPKIDLSKLRDPFGYEDNTNATPCENGATVEGSEAPFVVGASGSVEQARETDGADESGSSEVDGERTEGCKSDVQDEDDEVTFLGQTTKECPHI